MYKPGVSQWDTEDIAAEFIEQEVGRFDWQTNWPKFKANQGDEAGLKLRIKKWLDYIGIDYPPEELIKYLDTLTKERTGLWR